MNLSNGGAVSGLGWEIRSSKSHCLWHLSRSTKGGKVGKSGSRKGGEERDKNKKTWENIGCIHERDIYIYWTYIYTYVITCYSYIPPMSWFFKWINKHFFRPRCFLFFWDGGMEASKRWHGRFYVVEVPNSLAWTVATAAQTDCAPGQMSHTTWDKCKVFADFVLKAAYTVNIDIMLLYMFTFFPHDHGSGKWPAWRLQLILPGLHFPLNHDL